MVQKIFFTRKTGLTFLSLLLLRNSNICCICCGCCYDDLSQETYSFMWNNDSKNDSKEKYRENVPFDKKTIDEMEKEKGLNSNIKIRRNLSFDKTKKNNSVIKKKGTEEEKKIITQYPEVLKFFLGKKIYEYLKNRNITDDVIAMWRIYRESEGEIQCFFDGNFQKNLKSFIRFGLMIDPQVASIPNKNIIVKSQLIRMFNTVLNLYDFYLNFYNNQESSIKNALKVIEENWEKGINLKKIFEKKYIEFESKILNILIKNKEVLCEWFWVRKKDILGPLLESGPSDVFFLGLTENIGIGTFLNLITDINDKNIDDSIKNEIYDCIKKIIVDEDFYKKFFGEMYNPLKAFFENKKEENKKEENKKEENKKKENKREENKKENEEKFLCNVDDLSLRIKKNKARIYLDDFIISLLTFKKDLVDIFEKENKKWLKWLKDQYYTVKERQIDKNSVFSEVFKENETFNGNLSDLDEYFCSMLCLLYKFLNSASENDLNENYKNLKKEIANFFCQKKKIWRIKSKFSVLPEDFYDTFFGFMATMYQKFLNEAPQKEEFDTIANEESNVVNEKKNGEEDKKKEIINNKEVKDEKEKKEENKGENENLKDKAVSNMKSCYDLNKLRTYLNEEKNLIKKHFGFYYIKKDSVFFKIKHKFCCKIPDEYVNNATFQSLLDSYKKREEILDLLPQENLILVVNCKRLSHLENKKIRVNDTSPIEGNEYYLKTILNQCVIKSYDKSKKKLIRGSSIFFQKNEDSLSGPSLSSPYNDPFYKNITNIGIKSNIVYWRSRLRNKPITYLLSQKKKNNALPENNIFEKIKKIKDFKNGEKIEEKFTENEKFEGKDEEKKNFKNLKKCLMFLKKQLNKENDVPVNKTQNIELLLNRDFCREIKNLSVKSDDFLDELKQTIKKFLKIEKNLKNKKVEDNPEKNNNLEGNNNPEGEKNDYIFSFIYTLSEFLFKQALALNLKEKEKFLEKIKEERNITGIICAMIKEILKFNVFFTKNKDKIESFHSAKNLEFLSCSNFFKDLNTDTLFMNFINNWETYYSNFCSNLKSLFISIIVSEVRNNFKTKELPADFYLLANKKTKDLEEILEKICSNKKRKVVKNDSDINIEKTIHEINNIIKIAREKKEEIKQFLEKLKRIYEKIEKNNPFISILKYYIWEYEKKIHVPLKCFTKYDNLWKNNLVLFENGEGIELENYVKAVHFEFKKIIPILEKISVTCNRNKMQGESTNFINEIDYLDEKEERTTLKKKLEKHKEKFLSTFSSLVNKKKKKFAKVKDNEEEEEEDNEEENQNEEKKNNEEEEEDNEEERENYSVDGCVIKKKDSEKKGIRSLSFDNTSAIKKKNSDYEDYIEFFSKILFTAFFPHGEEFFSNLNQNIFIDKMNSKKQLNHPIVYNDVFFGLKNDNNNCFLNGLMQCLFKCSEVFVEIADEKNKNNVSFSDFLKSKQDSKDKIEPKKTKFIFNFLNLMGVVHSEKKKYEEKNDSLKEDLKTFKEKVNQLAEDVKKEWRDVAKLGTSKQGDPQEALSVLFDLLHELYLNFYGSSEVTNGSINNGKLFLSREGGSKSVDTDCHVNLENIDKEDLDHNFYKDNVNLFNYFKENSSPIYKNFGILCLSEVFCNKCKYKNFTVDLHLCLLFDKLKFEKDNAEKIVFKCNCEAPQTLAKKIIRYFPFGKYCILNNKSVFDYLQKIKKKEIPKPIVYLENFEHSHYLIRGNKYKNVAVEMHSGGSLDYGHYWAMVKSSFNKDYYFECNDGSDPYSTTPSIFLKQNTSNLPYLYFFEKIEEPKENQNL